jgi:hypothetical protein
LEPLTPLCGTLEFSRNFLKKHCSIKLSKYVSSLGLNSSFVDVNELAFYSKNLVSVSAELSGLKGLAVLLTENESNRKMEEYA